MGRTPGDANAHVVLGNDFHGEMVLLHLNVFTGTYGFHQSTLYLSTRIVGMVQDAELGVTALAVQVELSIVLTVEVHTPLYQFLDLRRCVPDHLLHGSAVTDVVARNHRVLDVFLKVVNSQVRHAGHTTLCKRRIGLVEACLTDDADRAFMGSGHLQCVAHTSHTGTDDKEIILIDHNFFSFNGAKVQKKIVTLHRK